MGREGGEGWEGGLLSPAGFILTSFPGASHTSWNSLNYAPSMAQRSKRHSEKKCVTGCVLWRSYFINQHRTTYRLGQKVCSEYAVCYFVCSLKKCTVIFIIHCDVAGVLLAHKCLET